MSRRKRQFQKVIRQAGDVSKIIPGGANGKGEYLTKVVIEGKLPFRAEFGTRCSEPMTAEKQSKVRGWAK